jgi:acetyl-CoA carboxylase carboxyltransferase component
MNNQEKLQELFDLKEHIRQGGGEAKIKKQHEKGKLTARERLDYLFDEGTFQEYNMFSKHRCTYFGMEKVDLPADGVVTGYGMVNGRKAFAYAHDFTVIGGANGEVQNLKVNHILTLARQALVPCIGLFDSGGGRIQEGGDTCAGYVFHGNVMNSGVIPQINALMGPCAGAAVYSPALTDFILAVDKTCHAHITGPKAIERVTGEIIDSETLGGAMTHSTKSGVVHLFCIDDYDCIDKIKKLLSFFPQNYKDKPEIIASTDDPQRRCEELNDIIPEEPNKPYNMKEVIKAIADNHEFFEIQEYYATNIIVGFIRLNGMSIGVVANQPSMMAGCLDINASDKGARFIRTCDCFNIPLLSLVDTPGYLPGVTQEYGGIIRHGAKMLYAWSEATVPIIVCATRKVYGGANSGMMSAEMYPDFIFAWMTAERAIMGAEGAVNVIYSKELTNAEKTEGKDAAEALRAKYIAEYQKEFMNPYRAAERMRFNDVVEPAETRRILIQAFEMFWDKDKAIPTRKHGNMPV